MRALRGAIVLILALALPAPVLAADFQAGWDAANRGDYAAAFKEWHALAEQGHAGAQFNLGTMYTNGLGVPLDYTEAAKWVRLAAEQGHAGAQNNLGFMYDHGQGVARDQVKGLMWYSLAAARFPPGEDRNTAVRNREIVERKMTPDQLAEAQRLAREWKPK
jgi:TPR repeat protein